MGDEMKNKVEIYNRGDTDVVVGTIDGKTTLPPQARIAFDAEFGIMVAPPEVFEEGVATADADATAPATFSDTVGSAPVGNPSDYNNGD